MRTFAILVAAAAISRFSLSQVTLTETTFPVFSRKDTSRVRIEECIALSDLGINPYSTGVCVTHPLVIGLHSVTNAYLFPFLCDVIIAYWLLCLHGLSAAGLYLLHPLVAVAPMIGGGSHQLILLALMSCAGSLILGERNFAAVTVAVSTALSPASALFLFPGFNRHGNLFVFQTFLYFILITAVTVCASQSLDYLEIYTRGISSFPDPRPSAGLWWAIGSQQFEVFNSFFSILGIVILIATTFPLSRIFTISRSQVLSVFWVILILGPAPTIQDLILLSSSLIGESVSLAPEFSAEARRWVNCGLGAMWLFLAACWHWLRTNAGNFNFLLVPSIIVQVFLAFAIGSFIRGWK